MTLTDRPCILNLGFDPRLHELCRAREIEVVAVCGRGAWDSVDPAAAPATILLHVDDEHDPEVVIAELMRRNLADRDYAHVTASSGDGPTVAVAALVARALERPGPRVDAAVRMCDADLQKRAVSSVGIPTPDWIVIDDLLEADPRTLAWQRWPAVVRRIQESDDQADTICQSHEELKRFIDDARRRRAREKPGGRKFVVEGVSSHDAWRVDGWVQGGAVNVAGVGRRQRLHQPEGGEEIALFRQFDPVAEEWAFDAARPFTRDVMAVLGLEAGAFHLDILAGGCRGELTFSRCGAHVPGGLAREEVMQKHGVDLLDAALTAWIGAHGVPTPRQSSQAIGRVLLPAPGGVVLRIPSESEILSRPGVTGLAGLPTPGMRIGPRLGTTVGNCGEVLLAAESTPDLERLSLELVGWFQARVRIATAGASRRELWRLNSGLPEW